MPTKKQPKVTEPETEQKTPEPVVVDTTLPDECDRTGFGVRAVEAKG